MLFTPLQTSSGVPRYLQLMEQVKHAVETGALRPGDQIPAIRHVADELVINPNTVVRAYRELEHQGIIDIRPGLGAFVSGAVVTRTKLLRKAVTVVESAVEKLRSIGATDEEIRRLFERKLSAANGKELEEVT
jgi:GntR family transcriptional regulator